MHFLFLGINYWPDATGIAPFTTGRCEYLAGRGHKVTVFTGFPYYPNWRVPEAYRGRLMADEERNGVSIRRSWLYVPSRANAVKRILHEASFIATSTTRAMVRRGERPDLIVVTTPPLALSLSAIMLSAMWKIPFVQHVPDLQPDAALDLGMLRPGRLTDLLYGIERLGYRKAALVSTLTEAMRRKIIDKGIAPEKVVLFSDWARSDLFEVPATGGGAKFRQSLGLGDELLVVHAGNMGVKQGLEVILGAAERSRGDRSIRYLLVGDGAVRANLEARARALALDNVRFIPLLPDDQFMDLLAASDISLVTQQKSVADIVFPSKVITLMSSARAVIASVSPGSEVARVLHEADAGVLVGAEDLGALLDGIIGLRDDPARRLQLGSNGRAFARQFWEKQRTLSTLEAGLVEVVSGGKSSGTMRDATPGGPLIVNREESR
ncbi:MAG TPA: WcaI family glycosyltransferase [Candidatus Binataceae bacterium]|nr:WcaI family glycosyltransferase [Candidatus Binataceae bacterium]